MTDKQRALDALGRVTEFVKSHMGTSHAPVYPKLVIDCETVFDVISQPATPEGWKLVPEVMTDEMIDALQQGATTDKDGEFAFDYEKAWNAAIAAAPVHEEKV